MRHHQVTVIAAFAIGLIAIPSHAQGKIELYGGYSYLRPAFSQTETYVCTQGICPSQLVPAPLTVTTNPNLNGWGFSAGYMLFRWLGAKADISGQYGAALSLTSANTHAFLFGPEVRWPGHVSPFVHALFGGAHASGSAGSIPNNPMYNTVLSQSEFAFASAIGGGIDAKVRSLLWVRLIQVDDLVTRFYSSTQNRPRISAGIVVRF